MEKQIDKNSPEFKRAMENVKIAAKRLKLTRSETRGVKLAVEEIFKKAVV